MEAKFEALSNLFKNEEEAKKLLSLNVEEAASYLKKQHHLEFTIDELKDVAAGIQKGMEDADSDELTEDQLEDVAGGGQGSTAYNAGYYIGKGLQFGAIAVGAVAAVGAIAIGAW